MVSQFTQSIELASSQQDDIPKVNKVNTFPSNTQNPESTTIQKRDASFSESEIKLSKNSSTKHHIPKSQFDHSEHEMKKITNSARKGSKRHSVVPGLQHPLTVQFQKFIKNKGSSSSVVSSGFHHKPGSVTDSEQVPLFSSKQSHHAFGNLQFNKQDTIEEDISDRSFASNSSKHQDNRVVVNVDSFSSETSESSIFSSDQSQSSKSLSKKIKNRKSKKKDTLFQIQEKASSRRVSCSNKQVPKKEFQELALDPHILFEDLEDFDSRSENKVSQVQKHQTNRRIDVRSHQHYEKPDLERDILQNNKELIKNIFDGARALELDPSEPLKLNLISQPNSHRVMVDRKHEIDPLRSNQTSVSNKSLAQFRSF